MPGIRCCGQFGASGAVLGAVAHCVFTPVLLAAVTPAPVPQSDAPAWGARASGPADRPEATLRGGRLGTWTPACLGWTPGSETLLWMVLKRGLAVTALVCLLLHNIGCWCGSFDIIFGRMYSGVLLYGVVVRLFSGDDGCTVVCCCTVLLYGCFPVIEAQRGTWFRTRCPNCRRSQSPGHLL